MAEQTKVEKPIEIRISLPAWTLAHWQAYNKGRAQYADRMRAADPTTDKSTVYVDQLTARYYGALELIKAGYVHIEGLDALRTAIDAPDSGVTGLDIVALMIDQVSGSIEAALEVPLAWRQSLKLTISQNGSNGLSK